VSAFATFEVKGWCPGALRPMESGDGLLVRVRPWCGALTLAQADGLADIAARLGNGHIDLTRRANLQIRGMTEQALPELRHMLDRLGLLDPDEATEAARNVMVAPLAGTETRKLADSLSRAIAAHRRAMPPKFGWLVDEEGPLSIIGERADVALCWMAGGVAVRVAGEWLGRVSPDRAVATALGDRSGLSPIETIPVAGGRQLGLVGSMTGVAAAFGRLEARQLHDLVARAAKAGAATLHVSPWRALYIDALIEGLEVLGLIVNANSPLLRIDACPGAPACRSATVDTRRDACRLAATGFKGSIHVSGCAKGCARSSPADLVLVGEGGRYGVIHSGTSRDVFERRIAPAEVTADA
jgi:precorrin-3B synthase